MPALQTRRGVGDSRKLVKSLCRYNHVSCSPLGGPEALERLCSSPPPASCREKGPGSRWQGTNWNEARPVNELLLGMGRSRGKTLSGIIHSDVMLALPSLALERAQKWKSKHGENP